MWIVDGAGDALLLRFCYIDCITALG